MRVLIQTLLTLLLTVIVSAQDNAAAPAATAMTPTPTAHTKLLAGSIQKMLVRTAELMPEENYGFKPVDTVRTFGQIVGHVADSQYLFCSIVRGEKNPAPRIEKTKSSKADLIAALEESFAYCNSAYEKLTESSAIESVKLMGGTNPRIGVVQINSLHTIEHYGNLVTYLRMNGKVPPTSDPEFMKSLSAR